MEAHRYKITAGDKCLRVPQRRSGSGQRDVCSSDLVNRECVSACNNKFVFSCFVFLPPAFTVSDNKGFVPLNSNYCVAFNACCMRQENRKSIYK